MEIPQSGSDGLTLWDACPLESLVGTIHRIRSAATHGGDWNTVGDLRETMEWQLSNLDRLQHPYATRVREIFAEHDCNPSRSFLWDTIGGQLHDVKQWVYRLIKEIEEKSGAKTNIIPFVEHAKETEDAVPVEKAA